MKFHAKIIWFHVLRVDVASTINELLIAIVCLLAEYHIFFMQRDGNHIQSFQSEFTTDIYTADENLKPLAFLFFF